MDAKMRLFLIDKEGPQKNNRFNNSYRIELAQTPNKTRRNRKPESNSSSYFQIFKCSSCLKIRPIFSNNLSLSSSVSAFFCY